jgi:SAM-dependent methyltransferase
MSDRQVHWENVYATKDENAVSWFQETPDISLDLVRATGVSASASIIDIGGGASRLVDALLDKGFKTITVLDLSEKALAKSKARLGTKGAHVRWIVADITTWEPSQAYDVWHDHAALHFLTDPKDRAALPMPNGFQAPFGPVVTSLLEHLRPTDRSVAADCLFSVTMPIRSAIYLEPHSNWSKAATMRTKPQWGPSSGSNSADFDA